MAKIIHIAQMHAIAHITNKPTEQFKNGVIESQFKIAKLIQQKYKYHPVVYEGLYDDLNRKNSESTCNLVKFFFPKGLPNKFDDLSDTQKDFIYDFGSEILLLGLGITETVYKAIDKFTSDRISAEFENKDFSNIFDLREKKAIEFCKIAAKKHYQESSDDYGVLLIYGAAHDFTKYSNEEIKINRINLVDSHYNEETQLVDTINNEETIGIDVLEDQKMPVNNIVNAGANRNKRGNIALTIKPTDEKTGKNTNQAQEDFDPNIRDKHDYTSPRLAAKKHSKANPGIQNDNTNLEMDEFDPYISNNDDYSVFKLELAQSLNIIVNPMTKMFGEISTSLGYNQEQTNSYISLLYATMKLSSFALAYSSGLVATTTTATYLTLTLVDVTAKAVSLGHVPEIVEDSFEYLGLKQYANSISTVASFATYYTLNPTPINFWSIANKFNMLYVTNLANDYLTIDYQFTGQYTLGFGAAAIYQYFYAGEKPITHHLAEITIGANIFSMIAQILGKMIFNHDNKTSEVDNSEVIGDNVANPHDEL